MKTKVIKDLYGQEDNEIEIINDSEVSIRIECLVMSLRIPDVPGLTRK